MSWEPEAGTHPYPPANVMAVSSFAPGCFDLRWDDPATYTTGNTASYPTKQAQGFVTVTGIPQRALTATATIRVLAAPLVAGTLMLLNGNDLMGVAGPRTPGDDDFNATLGTTALIAQELATAIVDPANSFATDLLAVATDDVLTLAAVTPGEAGNDIDISTEDTEYLAASVTHLNGGADADTITIGGVVLTAITGTRTSGQNDFSIDGGSADTIATEIANAINDSSNGFTAIATAQAVRSRVILTAVAAGVLGNSVTLDSTSTVLDISSPTLMNGTTCPVVSNATWAIVGVNLYRSDTGERGPYFRINNRPIGGLFYRDCTSNVLVSEEIIQWSQSWISKGDAANNRLWRFRTRYQPIVKREGQAVPADSPYDVSVSIGGQTIPVDAVSGKAGEIDLINVAVYDPSTERTIAPVLPAADGSSTVLVTYHRQGNLVQTELDGIAKIHYRLTTVAMDPTGLTPSGYVETPLGYSPPVCPIHTEQLDYIWKEAIRRNRWILEQGGERVKLFIRRVTGVPCRCQWEQSDPRLFEVTKQPVNNCDLCYSTGFMGGFEGPVDIIIAPDDSERAVRQTPMGRRLENTYEVWTGPTPLLSQRDFIVKQNGERFSIGPVRRTQVRGVVLQQTFTIGYLDECDIRYNVPMGNLYELPWPETRYTRPEDVPCETSVPYPEGYDNQATPMATETPKIQDGREQRGRTPIWQNLTYGGKGAKRN